MNTVIQNLIQPTAWARGIFCFALLLVLRLPFLALPILPHYIELNPGVGFLTLFAGFWGWPVVIASFAASILGDAWFGMFTGLSIFKALGTVAMTAAFSVVWHRTRHSDSPFSEPVKWTAVSFLSVLIYAAWMGWGAEVNKLYPFGYAAFLSGTHHLYFILTFGLVAFCRMRTENAHPEKNYALLKKRWTGIIALSGLGACLAGWMAEKTYYQKDLFDAHVIGDHNGPLVEVFVVLFILLNIAGLLVAGQSKRI